MKIKLILLTLLSVAVISPPSHAIDELVEGMVYYEIGGGKALSGPPTYNTTNLTPGSLSLSLTNTCGNFDLEENIKAYFEGLANSFDYAVNGLIYAAQTQILNNLILYIIRRANPNLADMLEGAMLRYENYMELGIKSCEDAREQILNGENPFYDYIKIGRKGAWDETAAAGGTIAESERNADERPACIVWIEGEKRLCPGAPDIELVKDVAGTGYETMGGSGTHTGEFGVSDDRINAVWPKPEDAVAWITDAFGEFKISDAYDPSKIPATKMGTGVLPLMFQEAKLINDKLIELTSVDVVPVSEDDQALLSVPGITINRMLLKVIQEIEPEELRTEYIQRIATEFALLKSMEKIMLARRLITAGLLEPNIAAASFSATILNKYILSNLDSTYDILKDEYEFRQRIASSSAFKLMEYYGQLSTQERGKLGGKPQGPSTQDGGIIP